MTVNSQGPVRSLGASSPLLTAAVASLGTSSVTFSGSGTGVSPGVTPIFSTPQWGGTYPTWTTQASVFSNPFPLQMSPGQAYHAPHNAFQQWPGSYGQPRVPHPPPGFPPQPPFPPFWSGMWDQHGFPASVHGSPAYPFSPSSGQADPTVGSRSGHQWLADYPFGISQAHPGHSGPQAAPTASWTATTSHPGGATGPLTATVLGSAQPQVPQTDFLAGPAMASGELSDPEESVYEDSLRVEGQFSFPETLSLLASVAPDRVCERVVSDTPRLSDAEIGIGVRPRLPSQTPILRESPMVADVFNRVQAQVRGSPSLPDSVPDFPSAFPCGKYLKPEQTPFFARSSPIQHNVLPSATLGVSQEDLLLLPIHMRSSPRHLSIPDKTLADWEETARRGMETVSIMDSFLAGLVDAVKAPLAEDIPAESQAPFSLRSDLDPVVISSFIRTLAEGLRANASTLSRLHANAVLARRDILLGSSNVVRSASSRASMRVLPPAGKSLFGSYTQAWIKKQADENRDSAFALAPGQGISRPTKRPAPPHFGSPQQRPMPKLRREGAPPGLRPNVHRGVRGRGRGKQFKPRPAFNKAYPQ